MSIPSRQEGRIMIVTNVGRGAVDAEVPKTNGAMPGGAFLAKTGAAYGEVVWS